MGERTRIGLAVLGTALVLGVLGDLLLRATPWGVNLALWVGAFAASAAAIVWLGDGRPAGEGRWMIPVAVLFAVGVAVRDSPAVVALDVAVVILALTLAALRGRAGTLRRMAVSEYVLGMMYAGAMTAAGAIPAAVRDVQWREVAPGKWQGQAMAVARGVLLAAPLLLVFGALLVAADAVFEELVTGLFEIDASIFGHLVLMSFVAWISAGILTFGLLGGQTRNLAASRPEAFSLGIVEVGIVLGLLNALFLAFVAVQAGYLFGGADRVTALADLTYAEYARRGFFELVAVTALVIPVLLLAHWLFRPGDRISGRIFGALCAAKITLLSVIVASALYRMYLYQQEFGLTVQRVCATAFMAWLAFVLLWLALTVLRGRRDRFAFGALVAGFAVAFALNVFSPDALVARVNVARLDANERFDAYYLTLLSADAAPVLAKSLPEIGDRRPYYQRWKTASGEVRVEKGPTLQAELEKKWAGYPDDWRTSNLGRLRAERLTRQ